MFLDLGGRTYDLATRALVLAQEAGDEADLVEVPADVAGQAVRTLCVPVAATVTSAGEARRACRAGAVMIVDLGGLADEATVRAVAEGGAAIVGAFPEVADPAELTRRARAAEAAGMPAACILLSPALPPAPGMLAHTLRLAALGYPLVYSTGPHTTPAALSVAVIGGCRIVRTADVGAARRVCDVLAAVLEARR